MHPLRLFLPARTRSENEKEAEKEAEKKIRMIDKNRSRTREIISGDKWGERGTYHLTVNTTGWNIKDLSYATADFAKAWFEKNK